MKPVREHTFGTIRFLHFDDKNHFMSTALESILSFSATKRYLSNTIKMKGDFRAHKFDKFSAQYLKAHRVIFSKLHGFSRS